MSSKISYLRRIELSAHDVITFSDCKMLTISSPISSRFIPVKNFLALSNTIFSIAFLISECLILVLRQEKVPVKLKYFI